MKLHKIDAGHYWTDGGAMMGVLPWAIWGKTVPTDGKRRKKLALNLLLIENEDRLILVDSGLGSRLSERQRQIYQPSEHLLPQSLAALGFKESDITDLILTHLHFDHAGGLISHKEGKDVLSFPNAALWVQRSEWDMAKHPDELNQAAYNFEQQLEQVETEADLRLIDGSMQIASGVTVEKVGGHSTGSQIVEVKTADSFYIYAGDIIPTTFHARASVTSAYDVSRRETFQAKQYIFARLSAQNGLLLLDHDTRVWEM